MLLTASIRSLCLLFSLVVSIPLISAVAVAPRTPTHLAARDGVVKPKVFIISMFDPEAEIWWGIPEFDLLAQNITIAGFSPLYPDAHCTANGDVCQLVTGESGTCNPLHHSYKLRNKYLSRLRLPVVPL